MALELDASSRASVEAARLRALVESLGFGVLVEDEARKVSLANEAFCRIFGLAVAPGALVGADCAEAARSVSSLVIESANFLRRIEALLAAGQPAAGDEIRLLDGRTLERDYVPIAVDSVGKGHVWVYRDVTRVRRLAELERAAAVRDELRLAIDTIPGLVFSARPDGYVDFLNQRWREYTGMQLEDACGSGWETAIHPQDLAETRAYFRSALAAGKPTERETRLRRSDGNYRWFLFRAVPLYGEGRLVKWYGQTIDIDARKRAEALLDGEKRVLEMLARGDALADVLTAICDLVEANAVGSRCSILLVDATGARLEVGAAPSLPASFNDAMHGRSAGNEWGPCGAAVHQKAQIIVSEIESDTRWDATGWRELALRHGLGSCWSTPILSAEQKVLGTFALYGGGGLPTPEQTGLIGQFTHLTSVVIERKRAEAALESARVELSHVTRVTTLGELAASIAHEINQPLAAVVADAGACLNWLAKQPPELERVRESLGAIVSDGARAGEILRRIRALLSRSSLAHRRCDAHSVVTSALELVRPELVRQGVRLDARLAGEGLVISGDPVELQQVVLNLVLNAAEAERGLGAERRVVVVASSLEASEEGARVTVSVEDFGAGFDERESERLFAPFYTTKPGGLGMGLSIIRSIVERHRGVLGVRSTAGAGSTFRFSLPVASDDGTPG